MKLVHSAGVLVLSALALTGCEGLTGIEVADLAGFWNATEFAFADNTEDEGYQDIVLDGIALGGAVTLDIEETGGFTGGVTIPGFTVDPQTGEVITVSIGGTFSLADQETLHIDFDDTTEQLGLFDDFDATFTLDGDVLTFVNDDTSFDFAAAEQQLGLEPRGEVDATLSATLVRN